MKKMIVPTNNYLYNDKPHIILKCKRCKNEFVVLWNSYYTKTVCFCPSCGQPSQNNHSLQEGSKRVC